VGRATEQVAAEPTSRFGRHVRTGPRHRPPRGPRHRGAGIRAPVLTGRLHRGRDHVRPRTVPAAAGPRRVPDPAGRRREGVRVAHPRVTAPAGLPGTPGRVVRPAAAGVIGRLAPPVSVTRGVRVPTRGRRPVTPG
jgi:hypothetical protein